jgi:hypothetical protein
MPFGMQPEGKAWLTYFFLMGFLVAFFFIVLFNLGLDLGAAVPGFFFTAGICVPPLGSLLPDKHQKPDLPAGSDAAHYRNLLCVDQVFCDQI